jgi:hypothetical protein
MKDPFLSCAQYGCCQFLAIFADQALPGQEPISNLIFMHGKEAQRQSKLSWSAQSSNG